MGMQGSDVTPPRIGPYLKRPRGARNPPGKFVYKVHAQNRSVEAQWEALCSSHKNNARRCYDHMARRPTERPIDAGRSGLLRGEHFEKRGLWQYEVGAGARVWYSVDEVRHVVTVHAVHISHPKETE